MSGLKGIAKNLTASFSSHLVAVLQQVALTPLFLHNYGVAGFGEWLTLSPSVTTAARWISFTSSNPRPSECCSVSAS